jgi:hypothetical protein
MTTTSTAKLQHRLISGLLCGILLAAGGGCQTFSLSSEDFQRQQRGEMVDRETGEAVEVVGTIGCLGAFLGVAVAEVVKK